MRCRDTPLGLFLELLALVGSATVWERGRASAPPSHSCLQIQVTPEESALNIRENHKAFLEGRHCADNIE